MKSIISVSHRALMALVASAALLLMGGSAFAQGVSRGRVLAQVNKIRQRAGIPDATGDAMKAVKNERRLEFFLEGIRWFDEIRYNEWEALTRAHYARYTQVDGGAGVAVENIKTGRYLSPIPQNQLNAVPGLYQQNPDW